MKRSHKILIIFLVATVLFSAISAVVNVVELNNLKSSVNNGALQLVAEIKEHYPEVTDEEIAKILNSNTDTEDVKKELQRYGINAEKDWLFYRSESSANFVVVANIGVCVVACGVLIAIFIIYCRKNRRETEKITRCIARINQGDYSLSVEDNSENELSLLRNEIYKTTLMLKEQSSKSLSDKEKLKDSLSDISHQLKTPLTSIMIMLDNIIEDENMPEEIKRDFLNDIKKNTNSISYLVQQILILSKLDANTISFKQKYESVEDIFTECVQKTSVLAEIKGVEVESECVQNIQLKCDFKWLAEAISNITKNCIEHTAEGGKVRLFAEQNPLFTKIVISDNGCGIESEDLPHIFERFYKGKNSSADSVGIGLALAKTIIEKTNGSIVVNSTVGKGTEFVIKFYRIEMNK